MGVLRDNIDANPYTGVREVKGKLRLNASNRYLDGFFNGTPRYDQIKDLTRGKIYDVVRVEGFGDIEDVTIIDDAGNEQTLGEYFFDEVE